MPKAKYPVFTHDACQDRLAEAQKEIERLKRERDEAIRERKNAEETLVEVHDLNKIYREDLQDVDTRIAELRKERDQARKECERLREALAEVEGAGSIGQAWRIARQALEGK
jgi:chromosome segregation ATPase